MSDYDITLHLERVGKDLHVTVDKECAGELARYVADDCPDDSQQYADSLDRYLCNGWELVSPEEIGALTSDPYLISDDFPRDDNGEPTAVKSSNVWFFPWYQTVSLFKVIHLDGYAALRLTANS